jgi:regulatory protein
VDAYTTALNLLSRRELSSRQLRDRLTRRKFSRDEVDAALERLIRDRTVDDRRVALAYARMEASIKGRGKRRVVQAVQRLGIDPDIAEDAVNEVFVEVDEATLFEKALERRLKGRSIADLDEKGRARIVRQLAGQGFSEGRETAMMKKANTNGTAKQSHVEKRRPW